MNNFKFNQKVYVIYHSTYFFNPPMCGKILIKCPFKIKHHFSRKEGKCYWYLVKMINGLIVLVPETCIEDLKESIQKHNEKKSICPNDKYQAEAWFSLQKWQVDRIKFLNQ